VAISGDLNVYRRDLKGCSSSIKSSKRPYLRGTLTPMPILLFTGSRHGRPDVEWWADAWVDMFRAPSAVVVGDAKGVDTQAWLWATARGYLVHREFLLPGLKSPQRFHERDQRMANRVGPGDWALGFPVADSKGTWLTLRMCDKRGAHNGACPVRILHGK
jgi:hypothetical protein